MDPLRDPDQAEARWWEYLRRKQKKRNGQGLQSVIDTGYHVSHLQRTQRKSEAR